MGNITPALWQVLEFEHDAGDGMRIGLDDYPLHDESHRIVLNELIIDEYLNRDIGLESVPLFIHRLRLKMRQIMPYFNKLYASEEIVFDPLATFKLTTARAAQSNDATTNTANGGATVTSGSGARNVNSDTPQTMLSDDEDYATGATDATATSSSTTVSNQGTTGTNTGSSSDTSTTSGFQGAASDLLMKYRGTLLNIDMMILPELNELFLLVRSDGHEILPEMSFHPYEFGVLY